MLDIPKTITKKLSDCERFIIGLKQLCLECNVSEVGLNKVIFKDGSYGGHFGLYKATNLFD